MKDKMKTIASILLILLIPAALLYYNLIHVKFFGPKYEDARRKIFKETRSYNEGKIQQLSKYYAEYMITDTEGKEVIKNTVRHMFADYQCDELPIKLKSFMQTMRGY